jgi:cytochrome c oxidase assembly protein subunit 15
MAVDGWWIAEGHFLLLFPVEKWFRDTATFVEHTHRLFGVLVGLSALLACAGAWLLPAARGARVAALLALVAVAVQGTLGGLRVLADDAGLAFLHGALAQLVFAGLCAAAVPFTHAWEQGARAGRSSGPAAAFAAAARVALLALLAQAVLGAWYRHGLRPLPGADSSLRFLLHGLGALLVLASSAALLRRAHTLVEAEGAPPAGLERPLWLLPRLLILQLLLGGLAWAGFRPGAIGPAEWALSILHVLGGALLLADVAVIALCAHRLASAGATAPSRALAGGVR